MSKRIAKAAQFAKDRHGDQMYGDKEYYYHLVMVDIKVQELFGDSEDIEDLRVVAFLHDVLEDTDTNTLEIKEEFGADVACAVVNLTRQPGESKEHYNECLRDDAMDVDFPCGLWALKVKIADTMSNLEHSIAAGNTKRINKYRKQLNFMLKSYAAALEVRNA